MAFRKEFSGLGFQERVFETFNVVPASLKSGGGVFDTCTGHSSPSALPSRLELSDTKSMRLKYEPSPEPLHNSAM